MNNLMILVIFIILVAGFIWFNENRVKWRRWKKPGKTFPADWRRILTTKVSYYNNLDNEERRRFEYKIQEFLNNVRITGISTDINETDRVLVAASAIIPIFAFPDWQYVNLREVLLYPNQFDRDFKTEGGERSILGMVGSGYMSGKMILSKRALRHGFSNESDKKNTAIHEFVHLIDKADGSIDGIPSILQEKQYTIPWIDLIQHKIDEIYEGKSDINPYGATNKSEFFAVISEYFFERPKLLQAKHPKLYDLLEEIFNQEMISKVLKKKSENIGRNNPCPCGSGEKFKRCCGKEHYS
ncbi:MAG: zinc-dependent peptidase [Candidatus Neomarinimicrobiota bacterium]